MPNQTIVLVVYLPIRCELPLKMLVKGDDPATLWKPTMFWIAWGIKDMLGQFNVTTGLFLPSSDVHLHPSTIKLSGFNAASTYSAIHLRSRWQGLYFRPHLEVLGQNIRHSHIPKRLWELRSWTQEWIRPIVCIRYWENLRSMTSHYAPVFFIR